MRCSPDKFAKNLKKVYCVGFKNLKKVYCVGFKNLKKVYYVKVKTRAT